MLAAGRGVIVNICYRQRSAAGPGGDGLQRGQGRASRLPPRPLSKGKSGPRGHPRQHGQPGFLWPPTCGSANAGVAQTVSQATGAKPDDTLGQPGPPARWWTGRFTQPRRGWPTVVLFLASDPRAGQTSPEPTSPSTAASSPPGSAVGFRHDPDVTSAQVGTGDAGWTSDEVQDQGRLLGLKWSSWPTPATTMASGCASRYHGYYVAERAAASWTWRATSRWPTWRKP